MIKASMFQTNRLPWSMLVRIMNDDEVSRDED